MLWGINILSQIMSEMAMAWVKFPYSHCAHAIRITGKYIKTFHAQKVFLTDLLNQLAPSLIDEHI